MIENGYSKHHLFQRKKNIYIFFFYATQSISATLQKYWNISTILEEHSWDIPMEYSVWVTTYYIIFSKWKFCVSKTRHIDQNFKQKTWNFLFKL